MNNHHLVQIWLAKTVAARQEAHAILAVHENATASRVILLEDLLANLAGLPVDVEDYFREAVTCLEHGLTRAAIVLSWSGFFNVLTENMMAGKESELRSLRAKWKFKDIDELKEKYPEAQILDVVKEIGVFRNSKLKVYQGHLSKRNQCAHPTLYKPSSNVAIGFVDEVLRESKLYL